VRLIDHLIATGDLNGDGAEDAVAFLVDYTTGSADFVFLTAVLSTWTEPTPVEALMIGDRIPVKSLAIEGAQVIAELIAPGPSDVACCPTHNARKVFNLEDGRLVESNIAELGKASLEDLNSTSWRLVDLNLDQEPALPGTEVSLRFDDGQISGSAGCNKYSSVVTGEADLPQTFAVGPIAATRMLCSDPISIQETTYLSRLAEVVAWRYAFGYLSLTYKLEDNVLGQLFFAPQEP
jgi:heat shock protein HslJ